MTAKQKQIIDRYGDLERELTIEDIRLHPQHEELHKLEMEILSWYKAKDPELGYSAEGDRYIVEITPKAQKRSITDMAKLFTLLGKSKFLAFCTFPLGVLDKLNIQADEIVKKERTGARGICLVVKGEVGKAA